MPETQEGLTRHHLSCYDMSIMDKQEVRTVDYKVKDRSGKVAKRQDRKRYVQNARGVTGAQISTLVKVMRRNATVAK